MRTRLAPLVLVLLLLVSGNAAFGQDSLGPHPKKPRTADDFKPRTLKEVIDAPDTNSRGNKLETMLIYADIFPSRAGVTFTGSSRTLPQLKKEVLRQWARLYAGVPEGYTDRYETEMLFTQNGNNYWLAIRKDLLPHFKQVLRAGDAVDLNLIRVGSAKLSEAWEPMLLVESFGQGSDARNVEEEIKQLNDQEVQALLHNDVKTLAQLWSEDFVVTNPFNKFINKAQVLELTRSGTLAFSSYERQIEYTRAYGDTVVIAGRETVVWAGKMPTAGKTSHLRFTAIWIKQDGRWQEIVRQASMYQP